MHTSEFIIESVNRRLANEIAQALNDKFLPAGYQLKISDHFVDQIYNPRNQTPIVLKELAHVFARLLKFHINAVNDIPDQSAFVVQDRLTGIGMAFIKHAGEPSRIIATTIIRDVLKARGQPVIVT